MSNHCRNCCPERRVWVWGVNPEPMVRNRREAAILIAAMLTSIALAITIVSWLT